MIYPKGLGVQKTKVNAISKVIRAKLIKAILGVSKLLPTVCQKV